MIRNRMFWGFVTTLVVAILLRAFVFDVVSISNALLVPQFYPGDFLLVSKLSEPQEKDWVLIKNYPQKHVFSVRKILNKEQSNGWFIEDPALDQTAHKTFIPGKKILGKVAFILWSFPCKSSDTENCDKSSRIFSRVINQ